MKPLLSGIIQVTGPHDVGKTTFALECGASPDKICFIDDDVKGRATVQRLRDDDIKFGRYVDFASETRGMSQLEVHTYGMNLLFNDVKPNKFDVIIWDTWSRFANTFKPYVESNPLEFRSAGSQKVLASIKGALQWKDAQTLEAATLAHVQTLAPLVILTAHLKDHYVGSGRSGKRIPDASRTLSRVPVLRLWLLHNSNSPVPIALVLKRVDIKKVTDKGLRTVNVLPRKIAPGPDDQSLWDVVERYFNNPIGNKTPAPEETPTAFELSILDGTLTKEQQETLKLSLRAQIVSDGPDTLDLASASKTVEHDARIAELTSNGKSAREISSELKIPLPNVLQWLNENGEK